ncbi:MAG: quinone-dependent dihydroorotate dehydrogenase, partial [Deltaproteobacteria bacterium]
MAIYEAFIRPLLFQLDAEWVHDRTIGLCETLGRIKGFRRLVAQLCTFSDLRLKMEACGITFPNPIGLAPGYDKNGRAVEFLSALGFGFIEIGSVSYYPSRGNPKPRLFRLPKDRALVVNYGLPNDGARVVADRLKGKKLSLPLGINVVKTNRGVTEPPESDEEVVSEYVSAVRSLKDLGDYLCLNLSCPNTKDGREFFRDKGRIRLLLDALRDLDIRRPLFLKVSPVGGVRAIEEVLEAAEDFAFVSGFVFNLPPGKPDHLVTPAPIVSQMPGAVSGKPIEGLINDCIREMYRRMDRTRYVIIGSGGVFTAEDAYRKIRLGSSLVQILTSLVYHGPTIAKRLNRGLCYL